MNALLVQTGRFSSELIIENNMARISSALFSNFSAKRALSIEFNWTRLWILNTMVSDVNSSGEGTFRICTSLPKAQITVYGLCMLRCLSATQIHCIYVRFNDSHSDQLKYILKHSFFGFTPSAPNAYVIASTHGCVDVRNINSSQNDLRTHYAGFHMNPSFYSKIEQSTIINVTGSDRVVCCDRKANAVNQCNFVAICCTSANGSLLFVDQDTELQDCVFMKSGKVLIHTRVRATVTLTRVVCDSSIGGPVEFINEPIILENPTTIGGLRVVPEKCEYKRMSKYIILKPKKMWLNAFLKIIFLN